MHTKHTTQTFVHLDPLIGGHVMSHLWWVQVSIQHHDGIGENKPCILWGHHTSDIVTEIFSGKYLQKTIGRGYNTIGETHFKYNNNHLTYWDNPFNQLCFSLCAEKGIHMTSLHSQEAIQSSWHTWNKLCILTVIWKASCRHLNASSIGLSAKFILFTNALMNRYM